MPLNFVHSGSSQVTLSDGFVLVDITVEVVGGAVVVVTVVGAIVDVLEADVVEIMVVVVLVVVAVLVVVVVVLVEVPVVDVLIVVVEVLVDPVQGKQFSTLSPSTSPGPLIQQGHV